MRIDEFDAADVDVKAAPPDGLPKYTILLIITDGTISARPPAR